MNAISDGTRAEVEAPRCGEQCGYVKTVRMHGFAVGAEESGSEPQVRCARVTEAEVDVWSVSANEPLASGRVNSQAAFPMSIEMMSLSSVSKY